MLMKWNYKDMPGKLYIHLGIVVLGGWKERNGVTMWKGRFQQYLQWLEEERKNSKTKIRQLTNDYISRSPLREEHYMYTLSLSSFKEANPVSTILNPENL